VSATEQGYILSQPCTSLQFVIC